MSTLNDYLIQKRDALQHVVARATAPGYQPHPISARVRAEGRSRVRRIRVRDFQIVSDSPPDFAGYDLGPSSPEIVLGGLGSCLTHTWLIQVAAHQLPLESLEVELSGQIDARAGKPGYEHVPVYPHNLSYTVHLRSPASAAAVDTVRAAVERTCPILNLLRHPQPIAGTIDHVVPEAPRQAAE